MSDLDTRSVGATADRRVQRTRLAIVSTFNRLILERGYGGLTPSQVAEAANVGRSTFYEHFRGLDDLLGLTVGPVLAPLADACFAPTPPERALRSLEHLWENRRLARALVTGEAHGVVLASFAAQFTTALARLPARKGDTLLLEPELVALHLAAAQLAVLGVWLAGRSAAGPREMADALHASGRATLGAFLGRNPEG